MKTRLIPDHKPESAPFLNGSTPFPSTPETKDDANITEQDLCNLINEMEQKHDNFNVLRLAPETVSSTTNNIETAVLPETITFTPTNYSLPSEEPDDIETFVNVNSLLFNTTFRKHLLCCANFDERFHPHLAKILLKIKRNVHDILNQDMAGILATRREMGVPDQPKDILLSISRKEFIDYENRFNKVFSCRYIMSEFGVFSKKSNLLDKSTLEALLTIACAGIIAHTTEIAVKTLFTSPDVLYPIIIKDWWEEKDAKNKLFSYKESDFTTALNDFGDMLNKISNISEILIYGKTYSRVASNYRSAWSTFAKTSTKLNDLLRSFDTALFPEFAEITGTKITVESLSELLGRTSAPRSKIPTDANDSPISVSTSSETTERLDRPVKPPASNLVNKDNLDLIVYLHKKYGGKIYSTTMSGKTVIETEDKKIKKAPTSTYFALEFFSKGKLRIICESAFYGNGTYTYIGNEDDAWKEFFKTKKKAKDAGAKASNHSKNRDHKSHILGLLGLVDLATNLENQ